ncbi:lipopolysaccharide biosynthesis protein [Massilia sp. MS-15]|uniref:lipopolysaccharide biosynthesis protein n=1 Tax=Massilia sp. MS-15 TaxID=2878200 RepID=UPI001CD492EA|nr:oligosaccharide flippase family protein [Massilia sp. MS-15]MCA1248836.1 oligosaccharide flippase family protein [Massilia sp. MS-15]
MHRAILSLGFVQALGYVFPFVTLWIVSRALDNPTLSAFLYAQALGALLAIPVEYGFHLSAVRMATIALQQGRMREVASEIHFTRLFLFLIASVAAFPIIWSNGVLPMSFANVTGVLLAIATYGFRPLWYFQATDRYGRLVRTEFVANIGSFSAVGAIAFLPGGGEWVVLAWALPRALGIWWLVNNIHTDAGLAFPELRRIGATLREAFPLFIHKLSAGAVHMATPVLLAYLISASDLAAYQKGERIVTAIQSLLLVISQVGYAHVMRLWSDAGQARSQAIYVSSLQVGGSVVAALGVYIAAPLLLNIFWGNSDAGSLAVLRTMCLLLPVLGINAALALNYLLPSGRDVAVVSAAVAGSLVSLTSLFVFADKYGPLSGVGSVLVGELTMTAVMGIALFGRGKHSPAPALHGTEEGKHS